MMHGRTSTRQLFLSLAMLHTHQYRRGARVTSTMTRRVRSLHACVCVCACVSPLVARSVVIDTRMDSRQNQSE
jgi:hypothetical protein